MSLSFSFSGSLFLSVGLIHIVHEANENCEAYFEKADSEESETQPMESMEDKIFHI